MSELTQDQLLQAFGGDAPEESVETWDVKVPEGSSVALNFGFNRPPLEAIRPMPRIPKDVTAQ